MFELWMHILYVMLRVSGGGSFPQPLSPQEERQCLARMREGDTEARNRLIEHNLRLVAHVVKKYGAAAGQEQEDLLSIGTIGLIKAIGSFRPERGAKLATYTARCIENEILMYFRASKKNAGEVLLSEPIETEADGSELSLMDVISITPDLAGELDARDDRARLYRAIASCLDARERQIIMLRYGLGGAGEPMTQRETAEKLGISRSYV